MKKTFPQALAGKKILFATIPADGHFNPLTSLAKYLQEAGCDVRWYTSKIFQDKLTALNIQHYPFVQAKDINATNGLETVPERRQITDLGQRLNYDLTNIFVKRAPEYYVDLVRIHKSFPFELLVCDSLFSAIPFVRVNLNIPVAAIGIVPLAEESKDLAPYGSGLAPAKNDAERKAYAGMRDMLYNVVCKESIDLFENMLDGNGIVHERSLLFDTLIKQSSVYLQIGTPSFEYSRSDQSPHIHFIGALFPYTATVKKEPWFDARLQRYKKIVLVTQGTVEPDTTKIIVPTLEAFKETDTLVIATTGGRDTQKLRDQYPYDNIILEDYIPFDDVMPHAHVYITNGGYGGTLLSIRHKLPIVAAGLHEVKNEVCTRIGHFRYGVNLMTEMPTTAAISAAVDQVMMDDTYKKNISRLADEINSYDTLELCGLHLSALLIRQTVAIS